MDEFLTVNCSTKAYVYDDYEIMSFENMEAITEESMKRFFGGKPANGLDYVPLKIFMRDFKASFDYLDIKDGPIKVVVPTEKAIQKVLDGHTLREYNPLGRSTLNTHIHFANIKDDAGLLKFCRDYGIPSGFVPPSPQGGAKVIQPNDVHIQLQFTHSIVKKSDYLFKAIELWKGIQDRKSSFILERWDEYKQLFNISTNADPKSSNWLEKAAIVLNSLLKYVDVYSVFERVDGKIKPFIAFKDIEAVAFYLFKKSIVVGQTIYKECENEKCGRIFEAIDPRSRFCPNPPNAKMQRSYCENAQNQRNKRKLKGERSYG